MCPCRVQLRLWGALQQDVAESQAWIVNGAGCITRWWCHPRLTTVATCASGNSGQSRMTPPPCDTAGSIDDPCLALCDILLQGAPKTQLHSARAHAVPASLGSATARSSVYAYTPHRHAPLAAAQGPRCACYASWGASCQGCGLSVPPASTHLSLSASWSFSQRTAPRPSSSSCSTSRMLPRAAVA